ncbi:acetamidase/formamidase family protein [Leucobacter luti]|uniref:acetamidase/formamidase family protein n=1 Tax=Leucobacter luti TaxID=340320 RepID=UPI003CFD4AAC
MLRISAPQDSVTSFSPAHPPVASVALGESFQCATVDCYAGQITTSQVLRPHVDMSEFNRATGPVEIVGVQPGDTLRIEIERISLHSPGVMALSPGLGILGEQITAPETRIVPIEDNRARIADAVSVPVEPMVGVLGLAPESGDIPNAWPGNHGGNLDTRLLGEGSALIVRASHAGALVCVGDLHALQGDGELGGTGIEIGGEVQLRVERISYHGALPAVLHPGGLSVLGSAECLEEAIRIAFDDAVQLMAAWHSLTWNDAYRLASVVSRAEVSQLVNPLKTARITIPAEWLPPALLGGSAHG